MKQHNYWAICLLWGSWPASAAEPQRTFATPREVVQATIDAAERNDTMALLALFGPDGKDIVESGDVQQDRELRAEFARSAHEKLWLDEDPLRPDRVNFTVGQQDWPFPVPVVRRGAQWRLDAGAGRIEILARRIGKNQLSALEFCRGYAEAQLQFAAAPRDGDLVLKYAQRVLSPPGHPEALVGDGPYRGYYFRVLRAQGPDAPGGAFDYVVNGKMIGGFALLAWPAEYGVSGIRTFLINHEGVVYRKDLGPTTAVQARQITSFNPDRSWRPVLLE